MNENERAAYELGYNTGYTKALLDSIERKLDEVIASYQAPEPKPTTTPERWWKRRPIWW